VGHDMGRPNRDKISGVNFLTIFKPYRKALNDLLDKILRHITSPVRNR
jgi:hypothetical protein